MKVKTSNQHFHHIPNCCCAKNEKEAYWECVVCGCHYTFDMIFFPIFICYTCGSIEYKGVKGDLYPPRKYMIRRERN